ncbi:protein HAPLESS 2-A-like [Selaginella moellendorffii]|uniref:protein HAPLESS 2-A-like n=1 Tax=Selaginella moellendorffii TaxID=88036 RepID=UPI000D1CA06F|nr:protein HAPLESS 2-A-like [Selaginella moellendorffii]|eukprot:XP_024526222.1 protein HAPLESS 2-A-like [Selaginella moellendorffii]
MSAINGPRTFIAYLIGDLGSYTQIPVLDGRYLFVPRAEKPDGNWQQFTRGSPRADGRLWMLVDEARVTLTGSACDRIGLSCLGYAQQPRTCDGALGMCIGEQLIDFIKEDLAALGKGRLAIHGLFRYGSYRSLVPDALQIAVSPTNSLITIEIAADNVSFRRNKSTGKIVKVEVPPFEAMSTGGTLTLTVVNDGSLEASYGVYVECSANINPLEGKRVSMIPNVPQTFLYTLITRSTDATKNSCIVTLRDSEGENCDVKEAKFSTTATVFNNGSQVGGVQIAGSKNDTFAKGLGGLGFFGKIGAGIKGIAKGAFNVVTSPFRKMFGLFNNLLGKCDNCPGAFDIGCFIAHFCVKKILFFVGGLVAAALAFYVLLLLQGMGILTPLCGCCCLPLKIMLSMRPSLGGGGDEGEEPATPKAAKAAQPEEIDYEGISSLFDEEEGHEEQEEYEEEEGEFEEEEGDEDEDEEEED